MAPGLAPKHMASQGSLYLKVCHSPDPRATKSLL